MSATLPPVKVGDILKLAVNKIGNNGDPVMVHEGFVIFLKDPKTTSFQLGRIFEVKITKVSQKFAFAERTSG